MMARKPFVTADEIRVCFPTKFEKHSRVLRSMELLERHGLVNAAEGGWRINVAGVNYLLKIAHTNVLVRGDKN